VERIFSASPQSRAGPADRTADAVPRAIGVRYAGGRVGLGIDRRDRHGTGDCDHGNDDDGGEHETQKNPSLHGILLNMTVYVRGGLGSPPRPSEFRWEGLFEEPDNPGEGATGIWNSTVSRDRL
jgi:hypothetical protein